MTILYQKTYRLEFVEEGIRTDGGGVTYYREVDDPKKGRAYKTLALDLSEEEHRVLMDEVLRAYYSDFMVTVAGGVDVPLHVSGPTHHVDGLMKAYNRWVEDFHLFLKAV